MLLLTFITLFLEHRDVGWGHTRRVVGVKITDGVIASKEVQISGDDDIKGDISPLIVKAVTEISSVEAGWCTLIAKGDVTSALTTFPKGSKDDDDDKEIDMAKHFRNLTSSDTGLAFAGKSLTIPIIDGDLDTREQAIMYLCNSDNLSSNTNQNNKGGVKTVHVLVLGGKKVKNEHK
mmetsp:Transcript_31648/g.51408  ORF Transcript_31648/g.51408 Transcript_31648/m.51408 type:complete len:177 (+) Transcript_31648:1024-1554(+)